MNAFDTLGLSPQTLKTLTQLGFEAPTPIQVRAIPPALEGKDIIGIAATGTGKTAAFMLPIIERHSDDLSLVLAPTRELALQIAEQAEKLSHRRLTIAVIIGGVGIRPQISALSHHPKLIVATPGRLVDHLQQGTVKLSGVKVLVLDEADRMLDMGFRPQLNRILAKVPRDRQTMLFSATMGDEVAQFAKANVKDAVRVEISRSGTTASRATQLVFEVSQNEKTPLLLGLLENSNDSTLVFTRTKRRADKVWKSLERAKVKCSRIHADRSQSQRQQALEGFREGQYQVLVATDIAARGIDVAEIAHVVNYDLPHVPADYVHRVGRTARASAEGRASSFCSQEEAPLLRDIEKFTRTAIPRGVIPRESQAFQDALENVVAGQAQHHRETHGRSRSGGGRTAPVGGGRGHGRRPSQGSRQGSSASSSSGPPAAAPAGGARVAFRGGPTKRGGRGRR